MSRSTALPPALHAGLQSLAARVRLVRGLTAAGFLVVVLACLCGLALAADYLIELPALVRQIVLVAWGCLGLGLFARYCLPAYLYRPDDADLAAAVDDAYPALSERITSTVELTAHGDERHGAPAFVALLIAETERKASKLDFAPAVSSRGAFGYCIAAGAALLVLLAPACLAAEEYGELAYRFLLPWNDRPPYAIVVDPGDVIAATGKSVLIQATVRPRRTRTAPAASATLVVLDKDGAETRQRLRADRADAFSLPYVVSQSGRYRIEASAALGDTRASSKSYEITAVIPVDLAPDYPSVTVTPPEYARATWDDETRTGLVDLVALRHSQVRFDLRFTRPALAARLEWTTAAIKVGGKDGTQAAAKTTTYPLALSDDGQAATLTLPATTTGDYRLVLEAEHGIVTERDGGTLAVKEDLPPAVLHFTGREELRAILPNEKLTIESHLADDVGVAKAELEYRINDGAPILESMPLKGAGRLEAVGQHQFALAGKVHEGDRVTYRLRIEDNLPPALGGPHVVFAPADRWLSLQVATRTAPLRAQEIAAQRDALEKKLEEIERSLLQEMRGLYNLKMESRVDPALSPEARDKLKEIASANQAAEKLLRDVSKEADATSALQPIATATRQIADTEMQKSEAALRDAGETGKAPQPRDNALKEADHQLTDAVQKVSELRKLNKQIAEERGEQMQVETLAQKQQELAEKADALAQKDPVRDPSAARDAEQLKKEQNEVADELRKLLDKSPALQKALNEARAEQAKDTAERARAIAQAERDLAQAQANTEKDRAQERLADLAQRQQAIADSAKKLADDAKEAARVAGTVALRTELEQKAADALKSGDASEALKQQEQAEGELNRLARDLKTASEQAVDPREAARQLARAEEKLRQRVQDERHNPSKQPLKERLDPLRREQEALRKAAEALTVPTSDENARKDQKEAVKKANEAIDRMAEGKAIESFAPMEQARQALERLSDKLATKEQRQSADALAKEQRDLAQATKEARENADKKGGEEGKKSMKEATEQLANQQAELQRKAWQMPGGPTPKPLEKAREAMEQAKQALGRHDAAAASQKQAEAAAALEQMAKGQAEPNADRPRGVTSKAQASEAQRLADEQSAVREAVKKMEADSRAAVNAPPKENPLGQLAKEQADLAKKAGELANAVADEQGVRSPLTEEGQKAERSAKEAADKLEAGAVQSARDAGGRSAERLRKLAQDLATTPRSEKSAEKPEGAAKDPLETARTLANRQEAINKAVDALANKADAARAQQIARQRALNEQTGDLARELNDLADQMARVPSGRQAAQQAQNDAKQAQNQMNQAEEQARGNNPREAKQSQEAAAESLERAARQAAQAALEQAASNQKEQQAVPGSSSPRTGQSMHQAQNQMEQARQQLGQSRPQGAQQAMQNAAQSLQQAAQQLADAGEKQQQQSTAQANKPNQPNSSASATAQGAVGGGRPDAKALAALLGTHAGKTWGELPGELRTRIVQDMKVKYGEDYARMIKLYFEQLADTKRVEK